MRLYIVLVCVLLTTPIHAGTPYLDANNAGEAAGMMYTKLIAADETKLQCEKVSKELGALVSKSISVWNETESSTISAANDIIKKLIETSGKDMTPIINKTTRDGIKVLFSRLNENAGPYCQKFAKSYSSDIQRRRTPKLFKYLDEYSIK